MWNLGRVYSFAFHREIKNVPEPVVTKGIRWVNSFWTAMFFRSQHKVFRAHRNDLDGIPET